MQPISRTTFITMCTMGCMSLLLSGCGSTRSVVAAVSGNSLVVPESEFQIVKPEGTTYLSHIIATHEQLKYPICVVRISAGNYRALVMRCTHQGAPLHISGDTFHCAAHGSEFSVEGAVTQGPADKPLQQFPCTVSNSSIFIQLT